MKKRVIVLMGGMSSERDVSLVSGKAIADALITLGHDVNKVDCTSDIASMINSLNFTPDVVFNALHGRYGEDGCIQGVLNLLNIPYTHSGVLASALAMDKPMAKRLFKEAGIPCAKHVIASRAEILDGNVMEPPYVVKPLNEGSSIGIQIVNDEEIRPIMTNTQYSWDNKVMVEKYIPGRELTVAVMGDRALGVTELRTDDGFYDYKAKYTEGRANHTFPASLPESIYKTAMAYAEKAHKALGCRGITRADLRYDDTTSDPGTLVMLEINTQPGMTTLSLVPEQAARVGIDFNNLVAWMVENAACEN